MSARILVIEDNPDIRQLITISLQLAGHTVEQAADGEAGLALAAVQPPDLIILDLMLPGIGGHDVARRLAANPATAAVPIMMLSARGQARDIDEGLANGARAYVVKPFSPRELVARVNEVLSDGTEGEEGE